MKTFPSRPLALLGIILLLAITGRAWLIQSNSVNFNSDEAVVALMARHITHGQPLPTFYYGQAYMGSLDALFIAGGFQVLGESVETVRWVQALLYLLIIFTAYQLALTITLRPQIALMTALLLAIPTMLGTLYTTVTLGGYNELILLGNLIFWLGWQITVQGYSEAWRWGLLGFFAGLGWWVNGAIITPILVIAILGLAHFKPRRLPLYGLIMAGFLIGSLPWWVYNLNHDWAALDFLLNNDSANDSTVLSPLEKILAFVLIGFSGLYGFRFPWEATFQTGLATLGGAASYLILVTRSLILWRESWSAAERWIWACFGVLGAVFILSSFQDPTGRYLMPLWVPATIGVALGIDRLRTQNYFLAAACLAGLLTFQGVSVLKAAYSPNGIQAQLDENLLTPDQDTADLIAFLEANGYHYGYTSYWVSYRTMFLSGERLIFDTSLPYDDQGYRPNNNRYHPYIRQVAQAEQTVWITHNFPALDAVIAQKMAAQNITYELQLIGVYQVYYDFSAKISPAEMGLNSPAPLAALN